MSAKSKLSLALVMLIFTSTSYAGIGEKNWYFAKDETDIKDFRASIENIGAEYSCKSFSPKAVSFTIKYDYPSSSHFPIKVISKSGTISQIKATHSFIIDGASDLLIQLPAKGKYEITNTTGSAIKGLQCGTGVYG